MDQSPPVKPPRGVKPSKETSGLLMSVIRTLSASETNEQRDKEKSKLEFEYKNCDRKLDELVSSHEQDLTKVRMLFVTISQIVSDNRVKIAKVKENLQDCKKKLHCRRDELRNLWLEGLEYKYMLQLLDEIQKINEVPTRLASYMSKKQYLHATQLLVEAVTVGKGTLEGVESLRELGQELEQKKEQLHIELSNKLNDHLYNRPAHRILALRRQESGRGANGGLLRESESRSSGRNLKSRITNDVVSADMVIEDDDKSLNPEENSFHFMLVLLKSLALLDKLPYAVRKLQSEMQLSLTTILQRSTQHIKDFAEFQNDVADKQALVELVQLLFRQFREVAAAHAFFLKNVGKVGKMHGATFEIHSMDLFWTNVQNVLETLVTEYLDVQNSSTSLQVISASDSNDLSAYFGRRKKTTTKPSLFKFDSSSSALTMSHTLKLSEKDKVLICKAHSNNILTIFRPFMVFVEDLEQNLGVHQGPCQLHRFLMSYVSETYLKRKSEEIIDHIDTCVRLPDAWKATVLLDCSSDYKPLLQSTVTIERCIREWRTVLQALPLHSEKIVLYSCRTLKEYKQTCTSAYHAIVQPHEDRRICSATWLKDEDISRFLKSLPNWLNLKAQQEYHARNERARRALRRDQRSEEESPEDIRIRNRREAEILASNLGEGGVGAGEILSDVVSLKELAQLQESMEWFSVRMFQYTSEFRQEPTRLSPSKLDLERSEAPVPVSSNVLQQLTSVAQEFDELANTCLLLLHLEVRVQCFHYLLAQTHYNKETHEPDPKVLELSRVLASVDEAMTSSLHPRKCKYIFEGLGHLIAKILISSAQYLKHIDEAGIQRMCRNIFALQQTLTNITMTRELALDHARHYFELFFMTPEEILNEIVEKGPEFSELEYMNAFQLLNRSKVGRDHGSVAVHLERLSDILGEVGVNV